MTMRLVRSIYDPDFPLPSNHKEYCEALIDLETFGVIPQIYFLLKEKGLLCQTPSFFQEQLRQKYKSALMLNLYIHNQTKMVLQEFEEQKISIIPLKGTMFAERYFGHVGARPTSDIDVLVHNENLLKSIEIIKSLGFTTEREYIPGHFHYSFSKRIPGSPIPLTVEIHWDVIKQNTKALDINEFWNQAKSLNGHFYVKELSDYHTFYFICLHGWRHNLDSLKYFIDILQMIHILKDDINYAVLLKDAAEHKTLKRLVRTLSIVYKEFPHLMEVLEFPNQRKTLYWDWSSFQNKDKKSVKTYMDFIDYQFFSYDSLDESIKEFNKWMYGERKFSFFFNNKKPPVESGGKKNE